MQKHSFGGDWTEDKLNIIEEYLRQYARIFDKNEAARFFSTWYVDAFAGTGYRTTLGDVAGGLLADDSEAEKFRKGSAVRALEASPGFHHYYFIEQKPDRAEELRQLRKQYAERNIIVETSEANSAVRAWCENPDPDFWRKNRAVVFMDPYGMNVDWSTIESIAHTKAIDFWLLFPLGMGPIRLLTRKGPPQKEWADRLTRVFGTEEWQAAFYPEKTVFTLFGDSDETIRDVDHEKVLTFFQQRLSTLFEAVAPNPKILYNSRHSPLYALCFAAANERGAPTAIRIANHLLRRIK